MSEPDEMDEDGRHFADDEPDTIGCWNCESGWKHTCMDDLCRGGNSAAECEDGGLACSICNPDGEYP